MTENHFEENSNKNPRKSLDEILGSLTLGRDAAQDRLMKEHLLRLKPELAEQLVGSPDYLSFTKYLADHKIVLDDITWGAAVTFFQKRITAEATRKEAFEEFGGPLNLNIQNQCSIPYTIYHSFFRYIMAP